MCCAVQVGAPGNWDHIVNQIGMFSYTGLTKVSRGRSGLPAADVNLWCMHSLFSYTGLTKVSQAGCCFEVWRC